jgi:glycosyltransferase involved in cell wall biosynthesis
VHYSINGNETEGKLNPAISVLVPVYNGQTYLEECLNSVISQDFSDYEILLSDDGSTDGSPAIIERYAAKDSRIRWWRNQKNLGLGGNFNHCLKEARGKYMKFLLQDDKLLDKSVLGRLVDVMEKNPQVSLIGTASHMIDSDSRVVKSRDYFRAGIWDGRRVMQHCLDQVANPIGEPSLLMFRKAQSARGFDERYVQIIDLEMWFYLLEQGDFAYIAEPLCAFRLHENQQSQINSRTNRGQDEHLVLLKSYFHKAWVRQVISQPMLFNNPASRLDRLFNAVMQSYDYRRMLFNNIHFLRRHRGERALSLIAAMKAELTFKWYVYYWMRRRIWRLFENICNSSRKRFRKIHALLRPASQKRLKSTDAFLSD